MIRRYVESHLEIWRKNDNRKPLLLRGARQVGKTTLIREFAKSFSNYVELNLERPDDRNLFQLNNATQILNASLLLKGVTDSDNPTLLFIDEIQAEPKAIQMLRYFHEDIPHLFVIAAGSLLEFALKQVPSFPVGRIEYLYLHPINFEEFLSAIGNERALNVTKTIPIPDYSHETMLQLFHEYAIIGGMPEIVAAYIKDKNISKLGPLYNRLWQAYKDDVEKYGKNNSDKNIIRHVINTAPNFLERIKFEGFGNSNYRSREVGESLRALDLAKIIQLIYPTTSISVPIIADLKKRPRLQFLDTGLLNQILMLQGELMSMKDLNQFYKGLIIQHLVTQELISIHYQQNYKPHFWVRQAQGANSEVDLVYRQGKHIIPIEIKSGAQGRLRSLHQFVNKADHNYAVRIYAGPFKIESHTTPAGKPYFLLNLPYYLSTQIPKYLSFLVENYS